MLVGHQVTTAKLATFVLLRSTLAALSACAELLLLTAISEDVPFHESLTRQTLVSKNVSYAAALLFLTSTGMTHAAGAYLPSSSVMILWMICASCYVRLQVRTFCALAVVATLCLGWPFGVIVFVPMGVDLLRRDRSPIRLLFGVALWACVVQAAVMFLDYKHYGKWTSAVLNIFRYNAQSGGDELYGIEPASFYFKNLSLNFNYAALLSILFLPASALLRLCRRPLPTSLIVLIAPLYLWLAIVVPRPHKEERFLFPVYPPPAPLKVLAALPVSAPGVVCTCGEWYRFPSSYYLPEGYQLAFLPSSFSGQLPKYFEAEGSRAGSNFNDVNREEQDRYVNPESCDYIFELETSPDADCLKVMMGSSAEWTKLVDVPFLNAKETAILHRILYVPFLHKGEYNSYSLYAKTK
ncbi:Alg9-like mannosyltransferase family [Fragilaria crotonensis]|nr:Alg9-like mannosyltransferase family [Fragilaria crotonensis]